MLIQNPNTRLLISDSHLISIELIWGLLALKATTAIAFSSCVTFLHHSLLEIAKFPVVLSFQMSDVKDDNEQDDSEYSYAALAEFHSASP